MRSLLQRGIAARAIWASQPSLARRWAAGAARGSSAHVSSDMQAVQIEAHGGPEVLRFRASVPKPEPGPGAVLVKNEWIGVNFIDTYFRSGLYQMPLPGGLGVEGAGVVAAVGPGVSHVTPGDRVAYITRPTAGPSYAEYSAVPGDKVAVLPAGVDTRTAAGIMIQGLTALAQTQVAVKVERGDWVLVHAAAGGTGQQLVRLASHFGGRVIGTTSTPEKAEVARRAGCSEVIIYKQEDVLGRVMEITGGKGVHIVYDGVGKATFDASLKSLDYLGWLICFGNASGKPDPVDVLRLTERNVRLMRPQLYGFVTTHAAFQALSGQLFDLVKAGVVQLHVHKEYGLADAAQAHRDLEGGGTIGKLLLRPG